MEFVPFPKIPRLKRELVITEKIDGTNAQVYIRPVALPGTLADTEEQMHALAERDGMRMYAGSRSRWLSTSSDNFGFAKWVYANAVELFKLGEGQHFGEWWGSGIQRAYGLVNGDKRFSLFNVHRWGAHNPSTPECCGVVPILARGDLASVDETIAMLREKGSVAMPGFTNPEGVVVFHSASKQLFKVLCENDDTPKGKQE